MTRWIRLAALALSLSPALYQAQSVDFDIAPKLTVNDTELPYRINLDLSVAAPTRIGVDALLVLREVQKAIHEIAANQAVIDKFGLQVNLAELTVTGETDAILVAGDTTINIFECSRTSERSFGRGGLRQTVQATLNTDLLVTLQNNYVVFEIRDLEIASPATSGEPIMRNET